MSILARPSPESLHRCEPPIIAGTIDIPSEPRGTVWECEECGALYEVREPPLVTRGSQRVPDEWIQLTKREARRVHRRLRRAS